MAKKTEIILIFTVGFILIFSQNMYRALNSQQDHTTNRKPIIIQKQPKETAENKARFKRALAGYLRGTKVTKQDQAVMNEVIQYWKHTEKNGTPKQREEAKRLLKGLSGIIGKNLSNSGQ